MREDTETSYIVRSREIIFRRQTMKQLFRISGPLFKNFVLSLRCLQHS